MPATKFARCALLLLLLSARLSAAEPPEVTALRYKAEKGNSIAQYNLGLVYAQGREVPVDLPEAFVWLSLAAENGSTGKALETMLGTMTAEQLAEGRKRLELHHATIAATKAPPVRARQETKNSAFTLNLPSSTSTTPAPSAPRPEPVAKAPAPAVATERLPEGPPPRPFGAKTDVTPPAQDELATLRSEKQRQQRELASLAQETEKARSDLRAASLDLTKLRTQVAQLEAALRNSTASETARVKLQAELTEAQTAATALAAKNQRLEDIASERGQALAQAQAQAAQSTAARDEARTQAEAATQALAKERSHTLPSRRN